MINTTETTTHLQRARYEAEQAGLKLYVEYTGDDACSLILMDDEGERFHVVDLEDRFQTFPHNLLAMAINDAR